MKKMVSPNVPFVYSATTKIYVFAMEDIEKDDYVIEYVGKIEYKIRVNNYVMKINRMNLWINGNKNGGACTIRKSLVQSKL
jgi:hypothetical protein